MIALAYEHAPEAWSKEIWPPEGEDEDEEEGDDQEDVD
jgi:hypothetical protein